MSKIVARKYALSLNSVLSEMESDNVLLYLKSIGSLFSDSKFIEVIKSPLISKEEKVEIITGQLADAPAKFINFIKVLAEGKRLTAIPEIITELEKEKALKNNIFTAKVESNKDFEAAKIEELRDTLSKKFGVNLETTVVNSGYDGVKVEIPDMGLRIDFSENHIKEQMITHILKAI
jgi:F-type H+-transporting ATPase subunit delta